jgi:hypothetical protein
MSAPYWVIYPGVGIQSECIEAESAEDAEQIARDARGVTPLSVRILPYPAEPRPDLPGVVPSACPSFCHSPYTCQGKSCCPQNVACSE